MTPPDVERAFAEHKDAVFRFAWRMSASLATAEDITQEVFLGLLASPGLPAVGHGARRAGVRAGHTARFHR